jgi:ketosteroid isomerase-like protein
MFPCTHASDSIYLKSNSFSRPGRTAVFDCGTSPAETERRRGARYNSLMKPLIAGIALLGLGVPLAAETNADLKEQVRKTELAFAQTMADRNAAAFAAFLSKEAVFLSSRGTALRGARQVADGWKPYFDGAQAPFSWEPAQVEVLDSGTLAMTSGPVFDQSGKRTGTFHSVWRREAKGQWRIVLDTGCPACDCGVSAK